MLRRLKVKEIIVDGVGVDVGDDVEVLLDLDERLRPGTVMKQPFTGEIRTPVDGPDLGQGTDCLIELIDGRRFRFMIESKLMPPGRRFGNRLVSVGPVRYGLSGGRPDE